MNCPRHQKGQDPITKEIQLIDQTARNAAQIPISNIMPYPEASRAFPVLTLKEVDAFDHYFMKDYQCLPKSHKQNRTPGIPAENSWGYSPKKNHWVKKERTFRNREEWWAFQVKELSYSLDCLFICSTRLLENSYRENSSRDSVKSILLHPLTVIPVCHTMTKVSNLCPGQPKN